LEHIKYLAVGTWVLSISSTEPEVEVTHSIYADPSSALCFVHTRTEAKVEKGKLFYWVFFLGFELVHQVAILEFSLCTVWTAA
jgi:hypothetical protein